MTLAENVGLPLGEFTDLSADEIREMASLKLAMVGLKGFEDFYPSQISGGMQKRAGLARAIALDPEILFFDEPSAGLDPISSRLLDDLILELRDSLGATIVVVTHELASIFAIGDNSVLLDADSRTPIAYGNPRELRDHSDGSPRAAFPDQGRTGQKTRCKSMDKQMNPAMVGAFVVGALALVVMAIMLLGSGRLFSTIGTSTCCISRATSTGCMWTRR